MWVEYNGKPYYMTYNESSHVYIASEGKPGHKQGSLELTIDIVKSLPKLIPPTFEIGDTLWYTGNGNYNINNELVTVVKCYKYGRYKYVIQDSKNFHGLATPYELHKIDL